MLDTELKAPSPSLTPMRDLVMLMNRNKGRDAGSISHCKVCGKEGATNHPKVNAKCPTHAKAVEEKWHERIKRIEYLLKSGTLDLVQSGQFNAQLTYIAQQLLKAREEHESYVPEEKEETTTRASAPPAAINEHAVVVKIREVLSLLDAKADAEKDPVRLLDYVMGNIRLLKAK